MDSRDEGGLLDMRTPAGRFVEEGEIVATITDPERPGAIATVISPVQGLLICSNESIREFWGSSRSSSTNTSWA